MKILKVKEAGQPSFNKFHSLESLHSEITILAKCHHRNVVKIKAASFDGTIVKEKGSLDSIICRCEHTQYELESTQLIRRTS